MNILKGVFDLTVGAVTGVFAGLVIAAGFYIMLFAALIEIIADAVRNIFVKEI